MTCPRCASTRVVHLPVDDRDGWPVYCQSCGWVGRIANEELA